MRICRIVNILPNDRTPGGGLVPYYLAKYIQEPTLYLTRRLNGYRPLPPHVQVVPIFPETTTPSNLREDVFGGARPGGPSRVGIQGLLAARMIRNDARVFLSVLREMARFRPDLVICGSLKRLAYGIAARYLLGSRLVLSVHNTTETAALRNLGLLRLLVRIPDRVIAVSPAIERELREFVPAERIRLSSTGVDLEECSNWKLPRKKQLLTIGSFKWKKGYRYLLEAVSRVFARHPDYHLVIVGDGPDRGGILKTVDGLGLGRHVTLTGVVPREEIVRLLNESQLFVMASLHEGLPKALLEALACGTPAVVTDGCNAEAIIEKTGLSVPAGDSPALAKALLKMIEDRTLWERCSRSGPAVAQRYDWRVVAAREYAVYREVVNREGHKGHHSK